MKKYFRLFFLIILLLLTTFMIISPSTTINAAENGFKLWYTILIPALLPFFIIAELMVSLGLIKFIGVILEPIMRPLFRLPGSSSVVVVMGFTSGFPVGAILCKKLYEENMLTANEAERLVTFTNNSSPLFIIGAIGLGMLASPAYGYLLAISHYLSNLILGFLWRFKAVIPARASRNNTTIQDAFHELLASKTGGLGQILGEAIKNSINNILIIAGFIIFFSVLTRTLAVWGVIDWFALLLSNFLPIIKYPIAYGLGLGIFEITLGANTIAISNGEIAAKLIAISILLAFSGFSIIAQVMSVVTQLPISLSFYLKSRLIQMGIATLITYIGYKLFLYPLQIVPSVCTSPYYKILYGFDAWTFSIICLIAGLCIISCLIFLAWLIKN